MRTKLTPKELDGIKKEFENDFIWYKLEQVDDIAIEQVTLKHTLTSTVRHRRVAIWFNKEKRLYNIARITPNSK